MFIIVILKLFLDYTEESKIGKLLLNTIVLIIMANINAESAEIELSPSDSKIAENESSKRI